MINMAKGFPKSMVYIVAHGDLCDSGIHTEPDLPWFRLHVPPPSNGVSLNILEPLVSPGLMGKVTLEPTTSG